MRDDGTVRSDSILPSILLPRTSLSICPEMSTPTFHSSAPDSVKEILVPPTLSSTPKQGIAGWFARKANLLVIGPASPVTDENVRRSNSTDTNYLNETGIGPQNAAGEMVVVVVSGDELATPDGELLERGKDRLDTIARLLASRPYRLTAEISCRSQLNRALACIQYLYHVRGIAGERLSACHDIFRDLEPGCLRFELRID